MSIQEKGENMYTTDPDTPAVLHAYIGANFMGGWTTDDPDALRAAVVADLQDPAVCAPEDRAASLAALVIDEVTR